MESLIIQDFKFFAPIQLGEKGAWAHLDTGASGNMIASTEVREMEEIERRVMQGGIGQQEVKQVRLGTFEFLGRSFEDETAVVFDSETYLGDVPFPAFMTLGADVLLAQPLILDFKRLWLGFAEKPLKENLAAYPMESAEGLPCITLHCQGQKMTTIFDTGAAYCIVNAGHVEEMGIPLERIYALEVQDPAGGKGELPIYLLEDVRIGEVGLGRCEAFVVNLEPIEQRLGKRIDFVLGANAMLSSALVWVLDEEGKAVHISERDVDVYA